MAYKCPHCGGNIEIIVRAEYRLEKTDICEHCGLPPHLCVCKEIRQARDTQREAFIKAWKRHVSKDGIAEWMLDEFMDAINGAQQALERLPQTKELLDKIKQKNTLSVARETLSRYHELDIKVSELIEAELEKSNPNIDNFEWRWEFIGDNIVVFYSEIVCGEAISSGTLHIPITLLCKKGGMQ